MKNKLDSIRYDEKKNRLYADQYLLRLDMLKLRSKLTEIEKERIRIMAKLVVLEDKMYKSIIESEELWKKHDKEYWQPIMKLINEDKKKSKEKKRTSKVCIR